MSKIDKIIIESESVAADEGDKLTFKPAATPAAGQKEKETGMNKKVVAVVDEHGENQGSKTELYSPLVCEFCRRLFYDGESSLYLHLLDVHNIDCTEDHVWSTNGFYATDYNYAPFERLPKKISVQLRQSAVAQASQLADMLPHGSGVDSDWFINQLHDPRKQSEFDCRASHHSMDEVGGYCHWYDFRARVRCTGGHSKGGDPTTYDFQLIKLELKSGQWERACCGFGLRDYLYDLIAESLARKS